jgi:hypothetical protein
MNDKQDLLHLQGPITEAALSELGTVECLKTGIVYSNSTSHVCILAS